MSNLQQNKAALFGSKGKTAGSGSAPSSTPSIASPGTGTSTTTGAGKTAGLTFKGASATGSAQTQASKQRKVAEAQELSEKAQQALKTSMFQWKPDHLTASSYFEKASELYKQAGELRNALLLMNQASESNEALGASGAAGLCKYKASQLAKDMGDAAQTKKLLLEAANLYGIHGDLTKYAELLAQLAGEEEDAQPQFALKHYMKAIDRLAPADAPREQLAKAPASVLDILRNAFGFTLRQRRFAEALKLAERMCAIFEAMELETSLCKTMLAITVVQLTLGDAVQAQQTYLQTHLSNPLYLRSKECELADLLVLGFLNQDLDVLDKAKMHAQVAYQDKEVVALIRGLDVFNEYEGGGDAPPAAASAAEKPQAGDGLKASLFASKKKDPVPVPVPAPVSAPAPAPAVPPPAPQREEEEEEREEAEAGEEAGVSLDDLVIDGEDEEDAQIDQHSQQALGPAAGSHHHHHHQQQQQGEDEDELDLT